MPENREAQFALKEFKDSPQLRGAGFSKELKMLESLRKFKKRHLTTHLATWTQGDTHYILFPLARCNLNQYMKTHEFGPNKEDNIWLLEQFYGLADALFFIHDMQFPSEAQLSPKANTQEERKAGWHHDLKLANILFFYDEGNERGILQIADFGSSKVNIMRSHSHKTISKGGTPTCEPPEIVKAYGTSRPYDVWSLGCVFLEVLVWAVFGPKKVRDFAKERIGKRLVSDPPDDGFWVHNTDAKPVRRPAVNQCIEDLSKDISERGLPFKETEELIVKMLEVNEDGRISAPHVARNARNILDQKRADLMQDKTISRRGSEASEASSVSLIPQHSEGSTLFRGLDESSRHTPGWGTTIPINTHLTPSPTSFT